MILQKEQGHSMSIFSNKKEDKRAREFRKRARSISGKLDIFRKKWFEHWIQAIEQSDRDDVEVKNPHLGGHGEFALMAYQLQHTSQMLAQLAYIPPFEGRDFADYLYHEVCGSEVVIREAMVMIGWYQKAESDGASEPFRVALPVMEYITGSDSVPVDLTVLMALDIVTLALSTKIAIADEFGDDNTIQELNEQLEEFSSEENIKIMYKQFADIMNSSDKIKIKCTCGKEIEVERNLSGKSIKCKICESIISVPKE